MTSTSPNISELRHYARFARDLAIQAGTLLKQGFSRSKQIRYKGRIDPVTQYDVKSEKLIVKAISKTFPTHSLLTEEGHNIRENSGFRWVVDPLDGTVNFAHGFPVYCVSIALEYDGEQVVGVVYDPEREELFHAVRGHGAFLNRRRLHVSTENKLERALLATGFAYDIATARRNNLGLFARMARLAQGIRRPGSAAIDICWLAAGRIDGFWELHLHPWDTAAAVLILKEAGGKYSRLDGRPYSIFSPDLLASNGRLHRQMRAVLSPSRASKR